MHRKFPSLEQFNKIFARETWEGLETRRKLVYRKKIKLHGTNMGIRIHPEGDVVAQARTSDLTIEDDLHRFALWLEPQKGAWATVLFPEVLTFFGEWAGPGIGKGDAVQMTGEKRFYIFAIGIGEEPHRQDETILTPRLMITDPETIEAWLPAGLDRDRVRVLPYEGIPLEFDFRSEESVDHALNELNALVDRVAVCDPYIAREFGIEKNGEGYVLVPHATAEAPVSCEDYSRMTFKAKTEKHRVQKQGKPATAREPLPETATQFVETFCTPQRVAQAIDEVCGGTADKRLTGKVIGWMTADIQKEAADELAALDAAGTPFERLKGEIANATRGHFMARVAAE